MVAPLRTLMVSIWTSCIAGVVVIVLLTLGIDHWYGFVAAGLIGLAVGVPAGIWTARQIKREDPNWSSPV